MQNTPGKCWEGLERLKAEGYYRSNSKTEEKVIFWYFKTNPVCILLVKHFTMTEKETAMM